MDNLAEEYKLLDGKRQAVLATARENSKLTIPSVFPDENAGENTELPQPNQSLGARAVNNLTAKVLLALFPPNEAFFKFQIPDHVIEELGEDAENIDASLQIVEDRVVDRIESINLRPVMNQAIKQLVVVGDCLLFMDSDYKTKLFRLNDYVLKRDPMGDVHKIVIKETVLTSTLSEETIAACNVDVKDEAEVDVYTGVFYTKDKAKYHQEINNRKVPDSEGNSSRANCPYIPLRWQAVDGRDYSVSIVDEYIGDLISFDGMSEALNNFAAIASKIVYLVKPNSTTDVDEVAGAESGDFVIGNTDDIDALQLEKYGDFQVVKAVMDELKMRLSQAFLMTTGNIRDAERVTREEIRLVAQELEDVLGGVYTVLAEELQGRLVNRLMFLMTRKGEIPRLPTKAVSPVIITGFDALGRGHDVNRLRSFFMDLQQTLGEQIMQEFNPRIAVQLFATGYGMIQEVGSMLKTQEQKEQEMQQAMASQIAQQAAPGVIQDTAKAQLQEEQPNG